MLTELILKFEFEASHSLSGYEIPHPHIWGLEISFRGKPVNGKVVDIVELRSQVQTIVDPLVDTYLNENQHVNDSVRAFPTCESLSEYFVYQIQQMITRQYNQHYSSEKPAIQLSSVVISIHEMSRIEMGAIRRILL